MWHLPETENRRVQEFKDAIQEQKLLGVVEKLVRKAFEKAKDVNLYKRKSTHQTVKVIDGSVYFLLINDSPENKRVIIYDLIHEMGHLFDPIALDSNIDSNSEHPASERSREIRAWAFADEEFKNHPELNDYTQEYTDHKRTCLLSYEVVI